MEGKYLSSIDAHSKWIEALPTYSSTSAVVIGTVFGLPETIVSDNGTLRSSAHSWWLMEFN